MEKWQYNSIKKSGETERNEKYRKLEKFWGTRETEKSESRAFATGARNISY